MTGTVTLRMMRLARSALLSTALYGPTAMAVPCAINANDHVIALNEIQNLMGRYSHLGQLRGEGTLAELFAMKTEGTSWHSPGGPTGLAAMKDRFNRPYEELTPGVLHVHAMLTPVIVIAGDGKTAKGVWDSFGPSVQNIDDVGGWLWVKYGVDFIKEDGAWKIWHLQVYPIFSTKYDRSITQTAKDRAARGNARVIGDGADRNQPGYRGPNAPAPAGGPPAGPGGPPPGGTAGGPPPGGAPGGPPGGPGSYKMPAGVWIYDGKSVEKGPTIPEPYCHFDPSNIYQMN